MAFINPSDYEKRFGNIKRQYGFDTEEWRRLLGKFYLSVLKRYNNDEGDAKYIVQGKSAKENLFDALILKKMLYTFTDGEGVAKIRKNADGVSYTLIMR